MFRRLLPRRTRRVPLCLGKWYIDYASVKTRDIVFAGVRIFRVS